MMVVQSEHSSFLSNWLSFHMPCQPCLVISREKEHLHSPCEHQLRKNEVMPFFCTILMQSSLTLPKIALWWLEGSKEHLRIFMPLSFPDSLWGKLRVEDWFYRFWQGAASSNQPWLISLLWNLVVWNCQVHIRHLSPWIPTLEWLACLIHDRPQMCHNCGGVKRFRKWQGR